MDIQTIFRLLGGNCWGMFISSTKTYGYFLVTNCPKNQRCVSENSVDCECKPGFSFKNSSVCVDIDECEARVTNALVFLRFRVWEP